MNTNLGRPTAKIFQFPVRAARRSEERRGGEVRALPRFNAAPRPEIVDDGAWYHAEAIADERRDAKQ